MSTFTQLLSSQLVTPAGPGGLVESLARQALCLEAIPRLTFDAIGFQDPFGSGDQPQALLPLESTDPERRDITRDITQDINDPADHAALADTLMALLKSRLGQRTIRSFSLCIWQATDTGCGKRNHARPRTGGPPCRATSFQPARAK